MAETFVAIRRGPAGFEQKVCLKRILPGYSGDPAFVDLFLDEARLLAQMRNGNVVQVYDFGEAEGTYYMALELVEGADLDALSESLKRHGEQLSHDVVLLLAGQLLTALDYAHTASSADGEPLSIVHRDVSPSNILVSSRGEIKLTDFGIAKARGRKHKTQTGHTKGKLSYMSPEQVRGEALDGRSDLFAVGIVLYELLTGVHPFEANTDLALLNNILTSKREPLLSLSPGISPELMRLVETMLAAEADARPSSAAEALSVLPSPQAGFGAQRALAQLVSRCVAERPASLGAPTPPGVGSAPLENRDGSTQVLPADTSQRTPAPEAYGRRTTHDMEARAAKNVASKGPFTKIAVAVAVAVSAAVALWLASSGAEPVADVEQPVQTPPSIAAQPAPEPQQAIEEAKTLPPHAEAPKESPEPLSPERTANEVTLSEPSPGTSNTARSERVERRARKGTSGTTENTTSSGKPASSASGGSSGSQGRSSPRSGLGVSSDDF